MGAIQSMSYRRSMSIIHKRPSKEHETADSSSSIYCRFVTHLECTIWLQTSSSMYLSIALGRPSERSTTARSCNHNAVFVQATCLHKCTVDCTSHTHRHCLQIPATSWFLLQMPSLNKLCAQLCEGMLPQLAGQALDMARAAPLKRLPTVIGGVGACVVSSVCSPPCQLPSLHRLIFYLCVTNFFVSLLRTHVLLVLIPVACM
jgi:hypothetical protein